MSAYKEILQAPPIVQSSGLSLQRNFAWSFAGNVVYALCQWGMIIVLAKLGNPFMVGQFSLGLALSTPVLMLTNLQLRVVQATDVRRGYVFGEYLGLRLVTTAIAFATIAGIACAVTHEPNTIMVVLAVGAAKSTESISDIFYGLFQLNNHLDQTGMSMMLKGLVSVAALTMGLYLTRDVLWGVIALAMAWVALLLSFDARRGGRFLPLSAERHPWPDGFDALRPKFDLKRQAALARLAFPLGIVMALVSLNLNMPRYFVHSAMGETELGVFSTMAYAMVAIATVVDAMAHAATPKLARLYAGNRLPAFRALLLKLVGLGFLIGLLATAVILLGGERLLRLLYGAEYAGYASVFAWLTAGAGISAVASLLTNGITSAKRFRAQVPMFFMVVGSNALACSLLVPRLGLTGAALAVLLASSVHMLMAVAILSYVLFRPSKESGVVGSDPAYSDSWGSSL
jgi:O-antigen/teichoic acid export membrane protein